MIDNIEEELPDRIAHWLWHHKKHTSLSASEPGYIIYRFITVLMELDLIP
jgi:hypothetical protein